MLCKKLDYTATLLTRGGGGRGKHLQEIKSSRIIAVVFNSDIVKSSAQFKKKY